MAEYYELAPPPRLADCVECLWVMCQPNESEVVHRVLPDGCADIVFTAGDSKTSLHVAGAMTHFADFSILPGQSLVGIRFHPGMWAARFGVSADCLTDQLFSLEELWGKRARTLLDQISNARSAQQYASLLAASIPPGQALSPLQRALAWMRSRHGLVSLADAAWRTGLSVRQFRRLCLRETGLSPKILARILRFRYALSRVGAEAGLHASLAADCGYFDQSHFIAEFQRFSGATPANYLLR